MSSKDMLASSKSMKTNSDAASTSNPANASSRQSIASLSKTSVPSSTREPIGSVKSSTCLPRGMGMAKNTTTGSAAPIRRLPIVSMPPSAKSVTSQPLVPKSAKGKNLIPDGATRSTKLHRDNITSQSKSPHRDDIISQGTKLYRDDVSKGTMLYRDDIDKGTKLFRDDIDQGTKLHRDDIEKGTKLNRDDISQGTMLFRDVSRSMAPPGTKSIFLSPRDISMASRQTQIELLPPKERDEQEQWAQELIRRIGACPEGYDWTRMPGGYQCKGRGHAITDDMLEEGKGGIWALPTKKWEEKEGPYYLRNGEFRKVKPSDQGP